MAKIIEVTTVLFFQDGQILLGLKKRGFGMKKYNGFGGKVKEGETVSEGAIRECIEEVGLLPLDLTKVAEIDFGQSYQQLMHVYVSYKWSGKIKESEEMKPKWFTLEQIPYQAMWKDDIYWLPYILQGKKILAKFIFEDDYDTLGTKENEIIYSEIIEVKHF